MKQIEYNLLEERWVRVRGQDYTVQEVSLPDALLHAHEYRDLAGELPTQDAAMLRLLLAVLHTVFSRVDENGTPAPFEMDPVHIFPINGDKENAVISRHFSTFTVNLVQAKSSKNKGF